jgi:hypothetical protein
MAKNRKKPHGESKHGLTFRQWSVLVMAFMLGVGGVYVIREIFPPQSAHAAVVHRMADHSVNRLIR